MAERSEHPTIRVNLWSGPRNISTAIMYSFAQRSDTQVVDEPLYGYYLAHTNADEYHPGAKEVLQNMETDGDKVIRMMMGSFEKPVVFFKQMTHHLNDLDRSFMNKMINIILTRDPHEMLPSFATDIQKPGMNDVGYMDQSRLYDKLAKTGKPPIVLDSKQVLMNPAATLGKLCSAIGIPFDESMLSWDKGGRPEDGVWAKYWYHNVHDSTGFKPYQPKKTPFPEELKPLLEECMPIYQKLRILSI
jgi:hypothetical protein